MPKFTPRFNNNIISHFLHINVIKNFLKEISTDLYGEIELFVMKIKLSATFEGRCSICKKKLKVFTAGDEDTHRVVTVCENCANRLGTETTSQVIEEYGKKDDKAFEEGIKIERSKSAG